MSSTSRVLIAELDSPAQAARFVERGAQLAITELTGMLRVGMLVSSSVLVTDAMLLDGAYFIALGPDGVLRELGAAQARYPLTITGVHDTLRQGLQARLENAAFQWSLPQIADTGSPSELVQRSWEEWIRYAEMGIIRYEKQSGGTAPMRLGDPVVESPEQREQLVASGLGTIRQRSLAWSVIDGLDPEIHGHDDVRRWWNDAYLRMIAENAGADWLCFESDADLAPEVRERDTEIALSAALREWARRSSPATISVAWDATEKQRRRLHADPSWGRIRDLAFAATQVSSAPSRLGVLAGSAVKLAVALVVVALAVPGFDLGSVDSPWAWVAFAGAIATTIPFDSLKALLALMAPDPRVRMILHRGAES